MAPSTQDLSNAFDLVITNIHIATMDGSSEAAYGAIENAALAVKDGFIAWCGKASELPAFDALATPLIDGKGGWVTHQMRVIHSLYHTKQ